MARREKLNILMIDTETCFKNDHANLVAEIGWTFGDINNPAKKPTKRRFIVADTYTRMRHWNHSQKLCNVHPILADAPEGMRTAYQEDLRFDELGEEITKLTALEGDYLKDTFKTWGQILKILSQDLALVDAVGAYNWPFDLRALQTTTKRYYHSSYNEIYQLPHFCLMQMCANTLINRWYFHKVDNLSVEEQIKYKSKSGKNLGYSAEIMARHIADDMGYIELHNAKEDSQIEFEIMRFFMKDNARNKKYYELYQNNVKGVHWQSIRDRETAKFKESKQQQLELK